LPLQNEVIRGDTWLEAAAPAIGPCSPKQKQPAEVALRKNVQPLFADFFSEFGGLAICHTAIVGTNFDQLRPATRCVAQALVQFDQRHRGHRAIVWPRSLKVHQYI